MYHRNPKYFHAEYNCKYIVKDRLVSTFFRVIKNAMFTKNAFQVFTVFVSKGRGCTELQSNKYLNILPTRIL